MTRSEILEFFEKRNKAWQEHNAHALAESHAREGEVESPLFGNLKGQNAILKSYIELLSIFPDMEFYSEYLLIDGDSVAQFLKMTGTQQCEFCGLPASGKRMQFRGSSLCLMDNDKIAREIRTYDFTGFLLQLGVLKAKPAF
jgi:predicted ester cyclase